MFFRSPRKILEKESPIQALSDLDMRTTPWFFSKPRPYSEYSREEKLIRYFHIIHGEAMNGTLDQFLSNSSGNLFHEIRDFLKLIDATEGITVMDELEKLIGGTVESDRSERKVRLMRYWDTEPYNQRIRELTTQWKTAWPGICEKAVFHLKKHVDQIK